ncbi:hypothetical protein, partial [Dysosmobacter sp. Sow4_B12]|uniref:hypothetical protein n=1 Tax=Dysosmobacter sp. Sow4_B12 TaxID=3438777 RepID=UPI003F90C8CC
LTPGPFRISATFLVYHTVSALSRTFFESFSTQPLRYGRRRAHRADSFVRIPNLLPFVNTFFPFFRKNISRGKFRG